jgi:vacuolar-type H+-ATPase subunit H
MIETDVIGHLIDVEHKAAALLLDAQTEADKRTGEAHKKADESFKAQYTELVNEFESNFAKKTEELTSSHDNIISKYRNDLLLQEKDFVSFNNLLDNLLFGN